jgi:hypothetical protein
MGNKIRIKQIDLQGFLSGSGQVDLLSASNYVSFVTQLDTTMSSDSELAAVSSSISQSIYTITQTLGSGLVSGSSQLTSSYDTRYVISGSITQTTWDNIASKPGGIVSSSTQISDLGFVTGSYTTINSFNSLTQSFNSISQSFSVISGSVGTVDFTTLATTGSNTFIGNQTITGSVGIRANSGSWNFKTDGTLVLPNGTGIYGNGLLKVDVVGGFLLTSYTDEFGSGSQGWYFHSDGILNVPGNIEGASNLATTSSLNTFTSSVNSRLNNIEATTSSYETKGSGIISGSSQLNNASIENLTIINLTTVNETTSVLFSSGSNRFGDFGNDIHSFTGSVQISGSTIITGSVSATSFNGTINSTNGVVSGSSQLTSSYDTRYTLSGSVVSGTTPAGTISGSSQLTSSFDLRYLVTGSVTSSILQLNTFTSSINTFTSSINSKTGSFATTGSNSFNGSQQITGSLVVSQNITGSASASFISLAINTTTPTQKIHLKGATGIENGTTGGSTADQLVFGYVGSNLTQYTHRIQTGHDAQAALNRMDFLISNAASTWKTPLQLRHDRVIVSGSTYVSGDLIVTGSINGTINATNGVVSGSSQILGGSGIFSSSAQLPAGTISGSSQLTSSYDTRYTLSGSVVSGTTPAGTISGSSQLTSSFDGRYTLTSSFNSFTASAQSVTTGSNSFNGTQTITGSLIITTGSFVASQILANTSSLYLTSGSNMYVQNNGLVEITGSLTATSITGSIAATNGVISGSTQLTTAFPSKTTGAWSVPAGASTQSFTVEAGASYTMWVNGNIPNGIITWNATVTTSNTNVPAVGSQYGWYYTAGNALVLTVMPDQIIGTTNTIISSPASYAPNTSNVFKFGITNNSGTTQTINYGYIKLS